MGLNRWRAVRFAAAILALPLACLPAFAANSPAQETASAIPNPDESRLRQIFADDAEREDWLDPLSALARGTTVEADDFAMLYTDILDRERLASARQSLEALKGVDRAALTPEARISHEVFATAKQQEIEDLRPEFRALTGVRPFNHFGGLHIEFPTLMSRSGPLPYGTEADYRQALAIDSAFATVLGNAELRFREGLAAGIVEPKLTVRNMIDQFDSLLAQDTPASPFYSPVTDFPETIPAGVRSQLRKSFAEVIRNQINPAYRRLRSFLAQDYLPQAREEVGISAMKGGAQLYRRLIERETTLKLDPDDVHRLGLSEVSRIRREMDAVKRELGFTGTLEDFLRHIREDPRFHPRSRDQLIEGFEQISRQVDRQIPRFFSAVPRTRLTISPFPSFRERYEPGGSYYQGSADGERPGTFYFNTYDLPNRFLTGMATLYLHEAVPGHHFQISLAQENEDLPAFQRFEGNSAFVEGWALYTETLGYEMGLYNDPMQHWGTLDDEMLRAMRLVVDTGLHAKGWSRELAIDYMLANSGMSRTDAIAEVERYIAIPAQALSYKIGALTIQELRRKAEAALGKNFDIREFHEQVLGSGALPLPVLKAKIENWIASRLQ